MNSKPTAGILAIILGGLVALIPKLIFPVCTDMIELMNGKTLFMKCHWSAMAEILMGILIVLNGIMLILFRKREANMALGMVLFFLGLSVILIPTVIIGMCQTVTMACRVGTQPALVVAGVIVMIVGICNVIVQGSYIKSKQLYKERSVI